MNTTKFISIFIVLLFMTGCCNALKKSRSIRIKPYVVEYYHYDDPEKPTRGEKKGEGWYEHTWENGFQMNFKLTRVEDRSGVYFYMLLYRATNPLQERVTLFDQNIELMDSGSGSAIEQIKCWNWQTVSYPCNVASVDPGREISKQIRFGYSTDEKYAGSMGVHIVNPDFEQGDVMINFYAKKPKSR